MLGVFGVPCFVSHAIFTVAVDISSHMDTPSSSRWLVFVMLLASSRNPALAGAWLILSRSYKVLAEMPWIRPQWARDQLDEQFK